MEKLCENTKEMPRSTYIEGEHKIHSVSEKNTNTINEVIQEKPQLQEQSIRDIERLDEELPHFRLIKTHPKCILEESNFNFRYAKLCYLDIFREQNGLTICKQWRP